MGDQTENISWLAEGIKIKYPDHLANKVKTGTGDICFPKILFQILKKNISLITIKTWRKIKVEQYPDKKIVSITT